MRLADIIASLQGGGDPDQAVIQAFQPGQSAALPPAADTSPPGVYPPVPAAASAQAAAPQEAPSTPTGVPTPVTNPAPATPSPAALQSPPDLANMYVKLMEKNQNAAMLDSGLTLMAAGLTPNQATRQALIQHAASGGGAGKGITSTDLINLQKQEQSNKDMLLRRSLLGGLAKQYKMTPEQIQYLETSGKLDEVIKHYSTENLGTVEDKATGKTILYNQRTGERIHELGGPKAPETQFVEGPEGQELRRKDTGERVGAPVGAKPPTTTDITNLAAVNKDRAAAGKPPMTMEEFQLLNPRGTTTNVNVSPTGVSYPKPPEGYDYERNADGTVKVGPDGRTSMYSVSPKAIGEEKETGIDIAEKERKAAEIVKKENKERVNATFTASNVGEAVDTALSLANKPGATGTFAKWARTLSPVTGMPWDTLDAKLKTIDANNVVTALNSMRAASPSGGALGNVTESENKMLASIIGATNPYQNTGEFKKGLIRIKAAMMVMAEQKYDDADGATRFQKDLKEKIDELSATEQSKSGTGVTIKPRTP